MPNANVEVFATSNACTGGILSAINPKKWGLIFDGADGPGGVDGCTPVSVGAYQATGVTDVNGNATVIVPPIQPEPEQPVSGDRARDQLRLREDRDESGSVVFAVSGA